MNTGRCAGGTIDGDGCDALQLLNDRSSYGTHINMFTLLKIVVMLRRFAK